MYVFVAILWYGHSFNLPIVLYYLDLLSDQICFSFAMADIGLTTNSSEDLMDKLNMFRSDNGSDSPTPYE